MASYDIKSVRTSQCVVIYSEFDCQGRSIRIPERELKNLTEIWESTVTGQQTLKLLYERYPTWNWMTKSFHLCNEMVGSENYLNVDLIPFNPLSNAFLLDSNELESHKDVCNCRNINVLLSSTENFSINNFGNSLVAYFEPDCGSRLFPPLWIPAGLSSFSVGFGAFRRIGDDQISKRILSFGPDPNAKYFKNSCLSDVVMEVELLQTLNSSLQIFFSSSTMETEQISSGSNAIKIYFYSNKNFAGKMCRL